MTEPLFSDFRVRKAMNQLGAKPQYKDGSDTDDYRLALHMRNEVEKYILENYFVGNVVAVDQQRSAARIQEIAGSFDPKSGLLVDILDDPEAENILANIVKPGYVQLAVVGDTFVPPSIPTYEIDEEGVPTGRRMVFHNVSGGEHSWEVMPPTRVDPDHSVLLDKRHGVKVDEGYSTLFEDGVDGESRTVTVRYLRRTHTPGPQP